MRGHISLSVLAVGCILVASPPAFSQGGKPFEETGKVQPGAVWDLSKPLWVFFAQERVLAPESPLAEWIPRAAVVHFRPLSEDSKLFLILAGVAYLGDVLWERDGLELEASLFTMLMPVGSPLYRDGGEVLEESFESSWTDMSLRARKTWGEPTGPRLRMGLEYELAWRDFRASEDTGDNFVLPSDTLVEEIDFTAELDTRVRGLTGDFHRGAEIEVGAAYEIRYEWNSWGVDGTEYGDDDAKRAATLFGSMEYHRALDRDDRFLLHAKLRAATGWNLDRLTYIRLGGGGFGRQFDRVGAGSTGAANDGELFRSDGIPGCFGGEFMTEEYAQLNVEMDIPAGRWSRFHAYGAAAWFDDVLDSDRGWRSVYGFGLGFTRIFEWKRGYRLDVGYSPVADRSGGSGGSADFTLTYLARF